MSGTLNAPASPMDLLNETPERHSPRVCWVVLADPHRARILATTSPSWELVESFESRSKISSADILAVPPARRIAGSAACSPASTPGQSVTPDTNRLLTNRFVRELAARLERGVTDRALTGLIVIAPTAILAALQLSLSLEVQRRVQQYIELDPTHPLEDVLRRKLGTHLDQFATTR